MQSSTPGEASDTSVAGIEAVAESEEAQGACATCWGCGMVVHIPASSMPPGGTPDDALWQCGKCQAIHQIRRDRTFRAHLLQACPLPVSRETYYNLHRFLGHVSLVLVPGLVLFIGSFVLKILYPINYPGYPTYDARTFGIIVVELWSMFQCLYNYCAAAITPPGSPRSDVEFGTEQAGEDERLKDFTFCYQCKVPRPPRTHHCSTCDVCVYDMQHHCMYIHNCVGYQNIRSFVLFLIYALVGCLYALMNFIYTVYYHHSELMDVFMPTQKSHDMLHSWYFWFSPPREARPLVGFVVFTIVLVMLLSMLLSVMLTFIARGKTQIEARFRTHTPDTPADGRRRCIRWYHNWHKTLGTPFSWLWPRRGPIPPEEGGRTPPRELERLASCVGETSVTSRPETDTETLAADGTSTKKHD